MKKSLLAVVLVAVLGVAAFAITKSSKNIKLVAETPCENIKGGKAEHVVGFIVVKNPFGIYFHSFNYSIFVFHIINRQYFILIINFLNQSTKILKIF